LGVFLGFFGEKNSSNGAILSEKNKIQKKACYIIIIFLLCVFVNKKPENDRWSD
jgi:hypothetical protein